MEEGYLEPQGLAPLAADRSWRLGSSPNCFDKTIPLVKSDLVQGKGAGCGDS